MSGAAPGQQGREAAAQRGEAERSVGPREGGWDEIARAAATRRAAPAAAEVLRQLLCVRVEGTPYAVPVENVREIVRVRSITPSIRRGATGSGVTVCQRTTSRTCATSSA